MCARWRLEGGERADCRGGAAMAGWGLVAWGLLAWGLVAWFGLGGVWAWWRWTESGWAGCCWRGHWRVACGARGDGGRGVWLAGAGRGCELVAGSWPDCQSRKTCSRRAKILARQAMIRAWIRDWAESSCARLRSLANWSPRGEGCVSIVRDFI